MVRIRIKLRLSKVPGKAGTIYYQISHKKEVKHITTNIRLLPEEWDGELGRVRKTAFSEEFRLSAVQRQLDYEFGQLRQLVESFELSGKTFRTIDIVTQFLSYRSTLFVLSYGDSIMKRLIVKGRLGSARNLRCTLSSFSAFLGGKDIPFSLLNELLVGEYADWLSRRGLTPNSSSFYMRNLRSVYNKAVLEEGISQSFPFQNVYTGIDKTAKRSVSEETIIRLKELDLSGNPGLCLARDLFLFSYCTRGMSFVDIAYLRQKNIRNGYINYTRRKTGQRLSVRIEPAVQEIINRYHQPASSTPYLFPILRSEDEKTSYTQYQTGLRYYNKQLKKLAFLLEEKQTLTSYTSRHTWANTARKHNVPLAVISDGMGHTSEKTTLIYLSSIDTSIIDRVNEELVSSLYREKHI